jgi:hypothetical protein
MLPSGRALRLLDAATAAWVAVWIGLGVAIGVNVDHLTQLSHSVTLAGSAVQAVGKTLGALGGVPFVGGSIGHAAEQIQQAGASTVASGPSSASSVGTLSWLLAVAVAVLPSAPVLGVYLPLRIGRAREARALARSARDHGRDPHFRDFLARRALASLPYRGLPEGAWTAADRDRYAEAELRRLGLDPAILGSVRE